MGRRQTEERAERWPGHVPRHLVHYLEGELGDVYRLNLDDWARWRLIPRVFRDVRRVGSEWRCADTAFAAPVVAAPWATHSLVHPNAERETARGVHEAGLLTVHSSFSSLAIGEIAPYSGPFLQQLYLNPQRELGLPFLEAAVSAGARGFMLTLDAPENPDADGAPWFRGVLGADSPPVPNVPGELRRSAADLGPGDVRWLVETMGLPVWVKGIMHPDDAVAALDAGAQGVVVSNHGGRQLGAAVSTARVLSGIVDAVAGRGPVWVDSGVRTGADVAKALALGAEAVMVGRPVARAVAAGGAEAVTRMLRRMTGEFRHAMMMLGVRDVAEFDRGSVQWSAEASAEPESWPY